MTHNTNVCCKMTITAFYKAKNQNVSYCLLRIPKILNEKIDIRKNKNKNRNISFVLTIAFQTLSNILIPISKIQMNFALLNGDNINWKNRALSTIPHFLFNNYKTTPRQDDYCC